MASRKQWVLIIAFTAYGIITTDVETAAGLAGSAVGAFAITYGVTAAYNNWFADSSETAPPQPPGDAADE